MDYGINQYVAEIALFRGVARGGAGGAKAPPEFSKSVNPIQTMGGRLCPSHYCQPPWAIYTSVSIVYNQRLMISTISFNLIYFFQ